jgi:peroxiredoxin
VSDPTPEDRVARLDPDRAAADAATRARRTRPPAGRPGRPPSVGLDPRRLGRLIGVLMFAIVIGYSAYRLTSHGSGTVGVPTGRAVRTFAAPLATSNLVGDANLRPPCTAAHHDPRALNTCLLLARGPLVLGFFVTDAGPCERAIDAMQAISPAYARFGVQFAAVAVHADRRSAAAAVRRHHWTIPVAYDRDGAVGESYGVAACPLIELVRRGGVVAQRLIGNHWASTRALAARVRQLVGS